MAVRVFPDRPQLQLRARDHMRHSAVCARLCRVCDENSIRTAIAIATRKLAYYFKIASYQLYLQLQVPLAS